MQKPTYVVVKKSTINALSFAIWSSDREDTTYFLDTLRMSLDPNSNLGIISTELNTLVERVTPFQERDTRGFSRRLKDLLTLISYLHISEKLYLAGANWKHARRLSLTAPSELGTIIP